MNRWEEYASIKAKIEKLEEKRKQLELELFDEDWEGSNTHQTPFGTFSLMGKRIYLYTNAVKDKQKQLSQLRKEEETNGKATLERVTQYIMFIRKKL